MPTLSRHHVLAVFASTILGSSLAQAAPAPGNTQTIDARALGEPTFSILSLTLGSWAVSGLDTKTVQTVNLPAGSYSFRTPGGAFPFTVAGDGKITYVHDSANPTFLALDAAQTKMTVTGFAITVDARELSEPSMAIMGLVLSAWSRDWTPVSAPFTMNYVPGGTYSLRTAGGSDNISIGFDGKVHLIDAPGQIAWRTLDSTGQVLTYHGVPVTIDARSLTSSAFTLLGLTASSRIGPWPTTAAQPLKLMANGIQRFEDSEGMFIFNVGTNGTVTWELASGAVEYRTWDAGTKTLTIRGHDVAIDARTLVDPQILLYGYVGSNYVVSPASPTASVIALTVIPGAGMSLRAVGAQIELTIGDDGKIHDTLAPSADGFRHYEDGGKTLVLSGYGVTLDERAFAGGTSIFGAVQSSVMGARSTADGMCQCLNFLPGSYQFRAPSGRAIGTLVVAMDGAVSPPDMEGVKASAKGSICAATGGCRLAPVPTMTVSSNASESSAALLECLPGSEFTYAIAISNPVYNDDGTVSETGSSSVAHDAVAYVRVPLGDDSDTTPAPEDANFVEAHARAPDVAAIWVAANDVAEPSDRPTGNFAGADWKRCATPDVDDTVVCLGTRAATLLGGKPVRRIAFEFGTILLTDVTPRGPPRVDRRIASTCRIGPSSRFATAAARARPRFSRTPTGCIARLTPQARTPPCTSSTRRRNSRRSLRRPARRARR